MKVKFIVMLALALFVLSLLQGCSHYKITDEKHDKVFYTKSYHILSCGAIRFRDGLTGYRTTLQCANAETISREEYKRRTEIEPDC